MLLAISPWATQPLVSGSVLQLHLILQRTQTSHPSKVQMCLKQKNQNKILWVHEIILPRFPRYFGHSFPYLHCWPIFYFPFFTSPTAAEDPKEVKIQNTQENASKAGNRVPWKWRHRRVEMLEVDARWIQSKNWLKIFNKIEQKNFHTGEMHTHLWEMLVGRQSKVRPTSVPYSNSHLLSNFKEITSLLTSLHLLHSSTETQLPTCQLLGMAYSIFWGLTIAQRGVPAAGLCAGLPTEGWWLPMQTQLVNRTSWAGYKCRNLVWGFVSLCESFSRTPLRLK